MRKILFAATIAALASPAHTQDIGAALRSVEQNNVELQAARKSGEAQMLDIKAQNNLEDPSVEYSPFFARGVGGVAISELIVSQSFDFPTLYAARSKSGKLQREAISLRFLAARRDILLAAKLLCLDIIRLNQERGLLLRRRAAADSLAALYDKRMRLGDATIIEVNKVKIDRMSVETELTRNDAEHRTALESLLALNGNMPLDFDGAAYPPTAFDGDFTAAYDRALDSELALRHAEAEVKAAEQEVKVSRQSGLPKLQIGYRRNTEPDLNANGFLVGASIPLFSNRHKTKMAKARLEANELQSENARLQAESRLRSLISQIRQTRAAAEVYDTSLLDTALDDLRKAVEGGVMSLTDYYVEADGIYESLSAKLQLDCQYQKLLAELLRNEL